MVKTRSRYCPETVVLSWQRGLEFADVLVVHHNFAFGVEAEADERIAGN
jgi:hypothetical protein